MEFKHSVLLNKEIEGQPPASCGISLVRARKEASTTSVFTDLVTDADFRNSAGLLWLTKSNLGDFALDYVTSVPSNTCWVVRRAHKQS